MAEVVKNSAEVVLKGLYSRNPAVVEAACHQAERLSAEEFLRLLHLFCSEAERGRMGPVARGFGTLCLLILSGLGGYATWLDHGHFVMGLLGTAFWMALSIGCFFYRSRYTNEDTKRVETSLRGLLKTTQSPALVEASSLLLYKRQQQEIAKATPTGNITLAHAAHETLLRVLPTLKTSAGWSPKDREALYGLLHDDTFEHKLASCILDAASRWRDVDALPQVSKLTKREDRPMPLRRHANDVMTVLLAERQKRQMGESLLRASEAPTMQSGRELLRPAASHTETPPEQLLRPS